MRRLATATLLGLGLLGTASLLLCLLVLLLLAEPPWLLPWFLASAGAAALAFGVGIPLLATHRRRSLSG